MKVFLVHDAGYACSIQVDLGFKEGKVIARRCYASGILPKVHTKLDCLLKPENGRTLRFEGCVREVRNEDIYVSIHSNLSPDGVGELINRIRNQW